MKIYCKHCDEIKETVGFEKDDPVLECGHICRPLTDEETNRIIEEEMSSAVEILMHEHGLSYEEAVDLYVDMGYAEVVQYNPNSDYVPRSKYDPSFHSKPRWVVKPSAYMPKCVDLDVLVGIFGNPHFGRM